MHWLGWSAANKIPVPRYVGCSWGAEEMHNLRDGLCGPEGQSKPGYAMYTHIAAGCLGLSDTSRVPPSGQCLTYITQSIRVG